MNDQLTGLAYEGLGRAEDALGGATNDIGLQAKGKMKAAVGAAQHALGDFKATVEDKFEDMRDQVHDGLDAVESYVISKPLPSIAIAASIGVVIGLLLRGSGKTIYLRDPR